VLDSDSGTEYYWAMSGGAGRYSLQELSRLGSVHPRTVRYYIQEDLLPRPERGSGSAARYSDRHLLRLRLVKRLQRRGEPLGRIRAALEHLDDDEVRSRLEEAEERAVAREPGDRSSALEYVRNVMEQVRVEAKASPPRSRPVVTERTHWERVTLSPQVELNVLTPLSRDERRRVERLIHEARTILGKEDV